GRPPRIFAAKKRPVKLSDKIYHAPLFNIFDHGGSCPGTHKFPQNIKEIPESFFLSFFTKEAAYRSRSKKHPEDLLKLWEELDGKKRYPLKDLVPCGKVGDIIE
ncbi:unnamed protein product, partial [marine sediment metagenome]